MKNNHLLFSLFTCIFFLTACGTDDNASRITIGTSNVIFDYTGQQYQMPFSVQVTDTQGIAAPYQEVSFSVVPIYYYKGTYIAGADAWIANRTIACNKEDANQNGILEIGEDINGNGRLDPTNPATIGPHPVETPTISFSNKLVTDELGNGYFSLIYPKSEANWVRVLVTASTHVTGTESSETFVFDLTASVEDMESLDTVPPGGTPYGKYGIVADCTDPD